MKDLSIYVHIPFCQSKCYYCGFCSAVKSQNEQKQYFDALRNEIESRSKNKKTSVVKTIYFGGGTPSAVCEEEIAKTLQTIKNCFDVCDEAEITIELNPNSTTLSKLKKFKKMGFNRLSFGVQSFNKKSLLFVGRLRTTEQAEQYENQVISCLQNAKDVGFKNINCDFILGLPFQKKREVKKFLKLLLPFATHFSCYMLQIESGTKLENMISKIDDDKIIAQYEIAAKFLKANGFVRYEISNFALPAFESKHNKVYWQRKEYLGFGQNASSFVNNVRLTNTHDFEKYINFWKTKHASTMKNMLKISSVEKLTKNQEIEEEIMLALRTKEGLDLCNFKKKFFDLVKEKRSKINLLTRLDFVEIKDSFLRLTNAGILLENEIVCQLCS